MLKVIHVLAVGLWFGAGAFFTSVVGLSLFDTFEKRTVLPAQDRPYWLPAPPELEKPPPSPKFPEPLRKEQGSRIAGAAVGPMFLSYYLLQVVCGVLGVATALAWFGRGGVHRWRVIVLVLALAGAGVGWLLDLEVERLREVRSATSDAVLTSAAPTPEQVAAADEARAKFGTWHTYSLFANFGTLALVTAAMAMAAALPPRDPAHAA
jgi:glycerol-3-phosphate acyltransferase PlsY